MSRPSWRIWAKRCLKLGLGLLVLAMVGRQVERTWHDLRDKKVSLQLHPAWAGAAIGLYLVGLSASGVYYASVLKAGPTPVGMIPAWRAYLISHLGKYVPGKAMVVVLRVGLSSPFGARPAAAAIATFYETLVMMAAGSLVAAIGFAASGNQAVPLGLGAGRTVSLPLVPLCLALAVLFFVVVDPRVFPRLSRLATLPIPGVGPEALPRLGYGLLGWGVLLSAAGWVFLGLSQVATVRALGASLTMASWPAVVAGVAFATVAGFVVAVLPGGLGVREFVIMVTLAPTLGQDLAVVSALILRLLWIAAEILAAAVLWPIRPKAVGASS